MLSSLSFRRGMDNCARDSVCDRYVGEISRLMFNKRIWILRNITKIQHQIAYGKYKLHRHEIARKRGTTVDEVEKILWHGSNETAVKEISKSHFNRGYASGANGWYNADAVELSLPSLGDNPSPIGALLTYKFSCFSRTLWSWSVLCPLVGILRPGSLLPAEWSWCKAHIASEGHCR